MADTYHKTTPSQEDGKKSEEKSMQILDQTFHILDSIDSLVSYGNTSTSNKKSKNVVVPVQGLSFKITKG